MKTIPRRLIMGQTTTMIFLLATLLMAASGQGQPSMPAPSPTVNEAMNCTAGLAICISDLTMGGTPSQECCTAIDITIKTQLLCLCSFIKRSPIPVNVTDFNARLSQSCGLTTDPIMCTETAGNDLITTL